MYKKGLSQRAQRFRMHACVSMSPAAMILRTRIGRAFCVEYSFECLFDTVEVISQDGADLYVSYLLIGASTTRQ